LNVIVDTNVLVAGLASRNAASPTRRLLSAIREGVHIAVLSPALVAEYRDVLNRPQVVRWHGLQPPLPDRLVTEMLRFSLAVDPPAATLLAPDPDDSHLWALLEALPDSVMVTGDKALLASDHFQGRVVTPRAFADAHLTPVAD
jgi:uncharacterized protein